MITNYTTLKSSIESWSHRSDLTSVLDDFIALAEQRLDTDLQVRELEATATGNLSGATLALPADFSKFRRFTINTTTKYSPENIGADGLRSRYSSSNGLPKYFAIVGTNIEFDRTPDSTYSYTLDYWKEVPALTAIAPTNDILTEYPGVYLFACLMEAAAYTKSDSDMQRYEVKYQQYLGLANSRSYQIGGPMRVVNG
jgi:hypothetical protein